MNASCSMFSQILKLIPRTDFERIVKATGAEYRSKGLSSWSQCVGMLFCQLGRAHSLREIEGGLKSCEGKLAHLGIDAPVAFLAVLRERPSSVAVVRAGLLRTVRDGRRQSTGHPQVPLQEQAGQPRLDRNRPVPVDVRLGEVPPHQGCGQAAPGARPRRLSAVLRPGDRRQSRRRQGRLAIAFTPGTIVVDDRGYNDYRLFAEWTEAGVYFVTRMKDNAQFEIVEEHAVPQNRNIVKNQTIRLTGTGAHDKCPHLLRRVEAMREDTGETLVFLTNHHGLGASTIAAIYKDRWQIELFFKALKQNLKIKTFVGTSANAVKTQIWTALIAMLLLRYLQLSSRFGWSLANLVALLRMNLFTHRDLMAWLDKPFTTPPYQQDHPQTLLAFA